MQILLTPPKMKFLPCKRGPVATIASRRSLSRINSLKSIFMVKSNERVPILFSRKS